MPKNKHRAKKQNIANKSTPLPQRSQRVAGLLKLPIFSLLGVIVVMIIAYLFFARRESQNIVLEPTSKSAVGIFSHKPEEWENLKSGDQSTFDTSGDFGGSVHLAPSSGMQTFIFNIQPMLPQLKEIRLLGRTDPNSLDSFQVLQVITATTKNTIEITARDVSFGLGFGAQQVKARAWSHAFGVVYNPEGLTMSSYKTYLGPSQTALSSEETEKKSQPTLSFIAYRGEMVLMIQGFGTDNLSFDIRGATKLNEVNP